MKENKILYFLRNTKMNLKMLNNHNPSKYSSPSLKADKRQEISKIYQSKNNLQANILINWLQLVKKT